MQTEKKLVIGKFTLKNTQNKIGLPPKLVKPDLQKQELVLRPQTSKILNEAKPDVLSLVNEIQTENKLQWINRCYVTFKEWNTLPDNSDQNREIILKQALQLIEFNDLQVRLMALKASLFGFMSMNLLDMLFGIKTSAKPLLRRPSSGSKISEQLSSVLYQPQQVIAILQKLVNLSNEKIFVNLLSDNQVNYVLFRMLKLFSTLPKDAATIRQALPYLTALFTVFKNAANNSKEQAKFLQPQFIQLIDSYLHTYPIDALYEKELMNMYQLITAGLRNLAIDDSSVEIFLQNGLISKLVTSMSENSTHYELILNTLRIMSKMSLSKECCELFLKDEIAMRNIAQFFRSYQANFHIIIRASFLLANMTTYFEGIRQLIFYKFKAFEDIYACFEYYWNKEMNPMKQLTVDQFGQSHAAWDFQIISSEKDIDALIRIIRLIANLLTIEQIGLDIIKDYSNIYKSLTVQLQKLLQKNNSIIKQSELISCCLSCLSNLTFYEKRIIIGDFEFKNVKLELINLLGHFIIQNEDQEICCDGLRLLSNLSRQKELIKHIIKSRVVEGAIVLLDSNSRDVVYYSLGVILNIMQDDEFKQKEFQNLIDQVTQVIYDCTTNENDIANLCLKCLVLLLDVKMPQEYAKKIEAAVVNFGSICDQVLKDQANGTLQNSRNLINQIINNLPEEAYPCIQPNCGRKFKTIQELQLHVSRRHKL